MSLIIYFTFIFFTTIVLIGWGNLFLKVWNIDKKNYFFITPILGSFFIGSNTLILHFFIPIGNIVGNIILIIGILTFFLKGDLKKKIQFTILISLISFITILFDNINRPDAALYHLPYLGYLNESKIILGLNNLEPRYGYASFLQYVSSAFKNTIFEDKALFFPIVTIFSSTLVFFMKNFYFENNQKLKIISLFFLIVIIIDTNRFSEFGNDKIAHIIFFVFIFYIFKFLDEKNLRFEKLPQIIALMSLMIFMIKGVYIILIFLLFYFLIYLRSKINLINSFFFFLIFVLSAWILKNFLISGCLIFPIPFTCFDNLLWSNNYAVSEKLITEAWAKSYPTSDKNLTFAEFISEFNWIEVWINSHLFFVVERIAQVLIPICLILLISSKKNLKNLKNNFNSYVILFFLLCFVIFWFVNFPVYRFGSGYIYAFICVFITLFIKNLSTDKLKKVSSVFLILCFSLILIKNSGRIIANFSQKYNNYPWLKIYSDLNNKRIDYEKIYYKDSSFFYLFPKGNLCFYSPGPCSYKKENDLKLIKMFNYMIISK